MTRRCDRQEIQRLFDRAEYPTSEMVEDVDYLTVLEFDKLCDLKRNALAQYELFDPDQLHFLISEALDSMKGSVRYRERYPADLSVNFPYSGESASDESEFEE